jgi:hypothetical protein
VEQALSAQQSDVVTVYRVGNVLSFYARTLSALLPPASSLLQALHELRQSFEESFFRALRQQGERLRESPAAYTSDLSPPFALQECLTQLEQIMAAFRASLVPAEQRDNEFAPVLTAVIDPLLDSVALSARALDASDQCVYRINVMAALDATLAKFEFTTSRRETLALLLREQAELLVRLQGEMALRKGGLLDKLNVLHRALGVPALTEEEEEEEDGKGGGKTEAKGKPPLLLSAAPGLDEAALAHALQTFYKTVFSFGGFVLPQCDRIFNPKLRLGIKNSVAKLVSREYALLYRAVHDPAQGYSSPATLMPHTPQQIDTVLDVA